MASEEKQRGKHAPMCEQLLPTKVTSTQRRKECFQETEQLRIDQNIVRCLIARIYIARHFYKTGDVQNTKAKLVEQAH